MWPEEDQEIVFNMILLHEESRDEDNAKQPLPYLFHHQTCLIHMPQLHGHHVSTKKVEFELTVTKLIYRLTPMGCP